MACKATMTMKGSPCSCKTRGRQRQHQAALCQGTSFSRPNAWEMRVKEMRSERPLFHARAERCRCPGRTCGCRWSPPAAQRGGASPSSGWAGRRSGAAGHPATCMQRHCIASEAEGRTATYASSVKALPVGLPCRMQAALWHCQRNSRPPATCKQH